MLRRGIEKESLRVTPSGLLAQTPHPASLGSALTHPHITTDFSEAQLELITGVHDRASAVLEELREIHQFIYRHIGDELLWIASMPCSLPETGGSDEAPEIPLGYYGTSNVGLSKTIYRRGLAHRYGPNMQLISGIHYNFSLPPALWQVLAEARGSEPTSAFVTDAYFSLIRNFRRHSWLLIYLLGASPVVCESFTADHAHDLETLADGTLYLPFATSLRMGPLGYQSAAQSSLYVSYNSLRSYSRSMHAALTTPWPEYEAIGTKVDGDYRQLSTALLQIENEFYGTIRPKRQIKSGERPLDALNDRGVEYVEVRCLDLNPFEPLGIAARDIRFLDVFLLHCLLSDSPADGEQESRAMHANQLRVVAEGRRDDVALIRDGEETALKPWANELLGECVEIAHAIDAQAGDDEHVAAVEEQLGKVRDASLTPSARILDALRGGASFAEFALHASDENKQAMLSLPLADERAKAMQVLSERSIEEQQEIERADREPFDDYLARYLTLATSA